MKIQEIKISIKEKCFVHYDGLTNTGRKENLQRDRDLFLNEKGNKIQIIESIEVENTDSEGKKSKYINSYSGYSVKYYEGELKIASEQKQSDINMQVKLTKSIMDLILKEAGGEIKELVKKEYEEFENQLIQLIDKTQNRNIFGNFVVSKFKKLKETILKNANNTF
jgi:hypothetical protein